MDSAWRKIELYKSNKNILTAKEAAETIIESAPIPLQVFDMINKKVYLANRAFLDFMCIDKITSLNEMRKSIYK